MSGALTEAHKELMRHALGIGQHGAEARRNYFNADAGSEDDLAWQEIVALGCAELLAARAWIPGNLYRVTRAGRDAVLAVAK